MFCKKCGTKLGEDSKFCHTCGFSIIAGGGDKKHQRDSSIVEKDKIISRGKLDSPEDYMLLTNIKSKKEAKRNLDLLILLFWLVFLSGAFIRAMENEDELLELFSLMYLLLLWCFIYFCIKVLRSLKLSKWNAVFCVIFAPISWLYLYSLMANPLKIILGRKELPEEIPANLIKSNRKFNEREKSNYKNILFDLAVSLFLMLVTFFTLFTIYTYLE